MLSMKKEISNSASTALERSVMSKSIKSLLYGIKKEKFIPEIMIGLTAVTFLLLFVNQIFEKNQYTMLFLYTDNDFSSFFYMILFIAPVTAVLCICRDFDDRTVYYEISGGARRKDVFKSRFIPAMIFGTLTLFFAILIPFIIGSFIWGLGDSSILGNVLLRYSLFLLSGIRVTAFACFISFLIRKSKAATIILLSSLLCISTLSIIFKAVDPTALAITNAFEAMSFEYDSTYNIFSSGIVQYSIPITTISTAFTVKTIAMSLIFTGVYAFLSWSFFKTDDME